MKVTKTAYLYRVAEEHHYLNNLYGKYFATFSERVNDADVIFLGTQEIDIDFPEVSEEELVARQIETLRRVRENLREEYTRQMNDYADRIRSLQLLTHQSTDFIAKDDDIE